MEIDQFAAEVAHELCNTECFAFTGEGPKPHSARCHDAARVLALAFRKFGDPMQSKLDKLRGEVADAEGAIKRMHDHCHNKSLDIEAGKVKSKMGANHYRDQAIGLSHAMDILHNLNTGR